MKKILLVDLDDTLLSFRKTSDEAIKVVFQMHNIPYSNEELDEYEKINSYYWQRYERKEISREIILEERFHTFLKRFGIETDGHKENEAYFVNLQNLVFYIDHAMDFLHECKRKNLTICLVSNGVGAVQAPRLKNSGIGEYLDKRYISEEVGYAKPDINFFEAIFKDFPNATKEDMVILGDSLTSDIQGGINAGITTVWFNPKGLGSDKSDYEIKELLEFFNLDIMK